MKCPLGIMGGSRAVTHWLLGRYGIAFENARKGVPGNTPGYIFQYSINTGALVTFRDVLGVRLFGFPSLPISYTTLGVPGKVMP
jgi:hypothetical protein